MADGFVGLGSANVVHQQRIWKERLDKEAYTASSWEENWGFLKGSNIKKLSGRTLGAQEHSHRHRAAARQKRSAQNKLQEIRASEKENAGGPRPSATSADAVRSHMPPKIYTTKMQKTETFKVDPALMESPYFNYKMTRTLVPKEKYTFPVTTTHEIGWRPTLELFGVAHYGLKKNSELMADRAV